MFFYVKTLNFVIKINDASEMILPIWIAGKNVTYAASLRTFLPGRVIAGNTLTAKLLFQLGVFAAKVTEALQVKLNSIINIEW